MTKQDKIQAVKDNQMSSIYSKDDVIRMLEDIDDSIGVSMQDIERIVDGIFISIDDALSTMRSNECFDQYNIEYTIRNGNQIEIDDLCIDFDHISSTISNKCKDFTIDLLTDNLKLKS
jgi:hypothetical protein